MTCDTTRHMCIASGPTLKHSISIASYRHSVTKGGPRCRATATWHHVLEQSRLSLFVCCCEMALSNKRNALYLAEHVDVVKDLRQVA